MDNKKNQNTSKNFVEKMVNLTNSTNNSIKKIKETEEIYIEVEMKWADKKSAVIRGLMKSLAEKSEKEQDEKIEEELEIIDEQIYKEQREIKKQMGNLMTMQILLLGRYLKKGYSPKEVYEALTLLAEIKLEDKELEKYLHKTFDETLLRNPELRNIYIAYSEKAENEKENNKPEEKQGVDLIEALLDEAEKNLDRKSLDKACELIKKLSNSDDKNDLQQRAAEINDLINEKIADASKALLEEFKITFDKLKSDFEKYDLEELKRIIDNLKKKISIISKNYKSINIDDFKQDIKDLNDLIFKYNVKEKEENKKVKVEKMLDEEVELKSFREILSLNKNRIKEKIKNKNDKNYMNTISVLCAKNKLSKLKYKLYKDGAYNLGKNKLAYDISNKIISRRLLKHLLNQEIGLKENCQKWLKLITIMPKKILIFNSVCTIEEVAMYAKEFFDSTFEAGIISTEEHNYFVSKLLDICQYRKEVDDFYIEPNEKNFITYVDKNNVIEKEKQKQIVI